MYKPWEIHWQEADSYIMVMCTSLPSYGPHNVKNAAAEGSCVGVWLSKEGTGACVF